MAWAGMGVAMGSTLAAVVAEGGTAEVLGKEEAVAAAAATATGVRAEAAAAALAEVVMGAREGAAKAAAAAKGWATAAAAG